MRVEPPAFNIQKPSQFSRTLCLCISYIDAVAIIVGPTLQSLLMGPVIPMRYMTTFYKIVIDM